MTTFKERRNIHKVFKYHKLQSERTICLNMSEVFLSVIRFTWLSQVNVNLANVLKVFPYFIGSKHIYANFAL